MDSRLGEQIYDPRRGTDRIQALLQSFTSPTNHCPYYDKSVRSTCILDPRSRRAWDCQGICFTKGFCCNHIIDKSAEIEELMKTLRYFPKKEK